MQRGGGHKVPLLAEEVVPTNSCQVRQSQVFLTGATLVSWLCVNWGPYIQEYSPHKVDLMCLQIKTVQVEVARGKGSGNARRWERGKYDQNIMYKSLKELINIVI